MRIINANFFRASIRSHRANVESLVKHAESRFAAFLTRRFGSAFTRGRVDTNTTAAAAMLLLSTHVLKKRGASAYLAHEKVKLSEL